MGRAARRRAEPPRSRAARAADWRGADARRWCRRLRPDAGRAACGAGGGGAFKRCAKLPKLDGDARRRRARARAGRRRRRGRQRGSPSSALDAEERGDAAAGECALRRSFCLDRLRRSSRGRLIRPSARDQRLLRRPRRTLATCARDVLAGRREFFVPPHGSALLVLTRRRCAARRALHVDHAARGGAAAPSLALLGCARPRVARPDARVSRVAARRAPAGRRLRSRWRRGALARRRGRSVSTEPRALLEDRRRPRSSLGPAGRSASAT